MGWINNGYAVGGNSKVKCQQIELIIKYILALLRLSNKFVRVSESYYFTPVKITDAAASLNILYISYHPKLRYNRAAFAF